LDDFDDEQEVEDTNSDDSDKDPTYVRGMEQMSEKEIREMVKAKKMQEIFGQVQPSNPTHAKVLARIDEIINDSGRFEAAMAAQGYDAFMDILFDPGKENIRESSIICTLKIWYETN